MLGKTNAVIGKTGSIELDGTAMAPDVLEGKTFYSTDAEISNIGTMPNRTSYELNFTPSYGSQLVVLPEGYYKNNYIRCYYIDPPTLSYSNEAGGVNNFNITLSAIHTRALMVLIAFSNGSETFNVKAKRVSGSGVKLSRKDYHTLSSPLNSSVVAYSLYELTTGSVDAVLNIYATADTGTTGTKSAGFIVRIYKYADPEH